MKIPGEIGSGKHEIIIILIHLYKQTLSGLSAVDLTTAGREMARTQVFMKQLPSNFARRKDSGVDCIVCTLLAKIIETLFVGQNVMKSYYLDDLSSLL